MTNFDRLDLNANHSDASHDVDSNLNLKCDCKYYLTHDFHLLKLEHNVDKNKSFSVMNTNICSININLEKLETLQ